MLHGKPTLPAPRRISQTMLKIMVTTGTLCGPGLTQGGRRRNIRKHRRSRPYGGVGGQEGLCNDDP